MIRLPLLLVALLAPTAVVENSFVFEPSEGLVLTKSWEAKYEISIIPEEFTVYVNGEEQPDAMQPSRSVEREEEYVWTDTYESVSDDGVLAFVRAYEDISAAESMLVELPDGDQENDRDASSVLSGASIRFTREDVGDDFELEVVDSDDDLDEDWLVELVADTDLLAFAPEEPVSEGDEWTVGHDAYLSLRRIGGNLLVDFDDLEPEQLLGRENPLDEEWEGDFTLTHAGTVERDDQEYVRLDVRGTLEADFEPETDAPDEVELDVNIEATLEVEGQLFWDPAAKRFAVCELEISFLQTEERTQSSEMGEMTLEIEAVIETTATIEVLYTIE